MGEAEREKRSDDDAPLRAPRHSPAAMWVSKLRLDVLAVVAIGGMIGATARFKLSEAVRARAGHFPWATFWTNLSGSFVLGVVLVVLLERFPPTRYLRPFLATGVVGAYTTMSTYAVETAVLLKDDHVTTALIYAFGSLAGGLTLAYAGMVAARSLPKRRERKHV